MIISKNPLTIALIICTAISSSLYASEQPTTVIEQTSPLCDMPPEIIQHIASFLPSQRDAAHLGATCKYLNQHAIMPFRMIHLSLWDEILDIHYYADFHHVGSYSKQDSHHILTLLTKLAFDIHTIAKRHGANPISIRLQGLNLVDHMESLKKFFSACSHPLVAPHIRELILSGNSLTYIPEEITGLTDLQDLDISYNPLRASGALTPLTRLESLKKLRYTDAHLRHLDEDFGKFKVLEYLNLSRNKLHNKDLQYIIPIKTLRELVLSENKFEYTEDLSKLLTQLPQLCHLDLLGNTKIGFEELIRISICIFESRGFKFPAELRFTKAHDSTLYIDWDVYFDFWKKHESEFTIVN
jgi:Leucine-rich repeat (LRR) protein